MKKKSSHLICKSSNCSKCFILGYKKGIHFSTLNVGKKCLHFGELIVNLSLINCQAVNTNRTIFMSVAVAHITVLRIFKCVLFYTVTDWF